MYMESYLCLCSKSQELLSVLAQAVSLGVKCALKKGNLTVYTRLLMLKVDLTAFDWTGLDCNCNEFCKFLTKKLEAFLFFFFLQYNPKQ